MTEVLMKFYGHLQPILRNLTNLDENKNLLPMLKAYNAKYHSMCQSSYSESKLKRFQLWNEKQQKLLRRKARMKFLNNEVVVQ